MSGVGDSPDRLEPEVENALDPGRFVPDRGCFGFVDGLEQVERRSADLSPPNRRGRVALYETFLAGCYEKAEEVDDSSGSFGMFAQTLICGWITARQVADACPHRTATHLLAWMDNDQYGFCHQLERQVTTALDEVFTYRREPRLRSDLRLYVAYMFGTDAVRGRADLDRRRGVTGAGGGEAGG